MARYIVGDAIRDLRVHKGITQEELSEGICTPATLSKIENGSQTPSRKTYEALMQRLGQPGNLFSSYMGREEFYRFKLCTFVLRAIANGDREETERLLKQYKTELQKTNILGNQFFLYTQALYHAMTGKEPEYVLQELEAALKLSMPDYSGEDRNVFFTKRHFYTFNELYIINNIGIQVWELGKEGEAEALFLFLKNYLERCNLDEEERARIYPVVLGNLGILKIRQRHFAEASILCAQARHMCITCGKLTALPTIMTCHAYAAREDKVNGNLSKRIEARRHLKQMNCLVAAGNGLKKKTGRYSSEMDIKMIQMAL